jgi:hypothetical protein
LTVRGGREGVDECSRYPVISPDGRITGQVEVVVWPEYRADDWGVVSGRLGIDEQVDKGSCRSVEAVYAGTGVDNVEVSVGPKGEVLSVSDSGVGGEHVNEGARGRIESEDTPRRLVADKH